MDGADEHVAESLVGAELFEAEAVDAVFEFAGGFVGEGEGDDAGWECAGGKDVDDAGGDDLGFAGTGTGDDLQVLIDSADGVKLRLGVLHKRPSCFPKLAQTIKKAIHNCHRLRVQ